MKDNMFLFLKWLFASIGGAFGYIAPSVPFVLICFFAIALDCYSAYSLSRRVRKTHPDANDGKFKSKHALRVFDAMLKISVLIVLSLLIDRIIIPFDGGWYLPSIVSGMFCFGQIRSILENESSENGARRARILQRIMVNKAERHFDIPLSDILPDKEK
jgi:hypothetical protein